MILSWRSSGDAFIKLILLSSSQTWTLAWAWLKSLVIALPCRFYDLCRPWQRSLCCMATMIIWACMAMSMTGLYAKVLPCSAATSQGMAYPAVRALVLTAFKSTSRYCKPYWLKLSSCNCPNLGICLDKAPAVRLLLIICSISRPSHNWARRFCSRRWCAHAHGNNPNCFIS